jgi:hypothetical protein
MLSKNKNTGMLIAIATSACGMVREWKSTIVIWDVMGRDGESGEKIMTLTQK